MTENARPDKRAHQIAGVGGSDVSYAVPDFRYRGNIEYRDTWSDIVIVSPISVIAQH